MIVGCVHDEILLEAHIEATDEVALTLKDTMEEAGRVLLKIVPVEAEVVIRVTYLPKGERYRESPEASGSAPDSHCLRRRV
jgi:hypothetical protein